ncbi:MAG: gamma-glutamyltransferase [Gammaproteobacteria bacterium]|nr:gamma-glutamyltransferase [Gammaproteobacteria bacterium]HAH67636.1 gamma-glutamyltransferase [Gammaproteobacteria bacterium]|tara:strand:- start:6507 stop:8237 length:1731 start_codon:yes stop_codon:yes gene_type:complete
MKDISPLLLAAFFLFTHSLYSQTSYIDYESPFHPTISDDAMVVSQNHLSSEVGIEIIKEGGNAIDAAVAVGFSLAVTLPRAGNLGGGGFMLVYLKDQNEIIAIDYRGQAPSKLKTNEIFGIELPNEYGDADRDIVRYGYKASTIPGTVSGLLLAHSQFGKLPLSEVMKPAINQAINGINVTFDLEQAIASAPQLLWDDESRRIYFNEGRPLNQGSVMRRPDLAKTMDLISKNGISGFYGGEVAKKIVESMSDNGGSITISDLREYKARFSPPIGVNYRGKKIFTHGPPSGGGIVLLTSLKVLEYFDLGKIGNDSALTYHLLAEALRRGHNNRSHHVGDPSYYNVPYDDLMSAKRIKEFAKSISLKKASSSKEVKPLEIIQESKNTTHYSIIDDDGNAVSNTYTLGYSFGSGVTIPGTGILMNNQMNNFAYQYGNKKIEGRGASPGNKYEPGKRPMSTMAPTIVFDENDKVLLITGSPGGKLIPAAILRVITGVIDFGLNIGEATMLPRIHKDWPYRGIDYERNISSDSLNLLKKIGHKIEPSKTMGSTQSIHIKEGINHGYADLRRPNAGVSYMND